MISEKFSLKQYSVASILGMIEADEFVIPEIQRPFVWKRTQVRDLIDSLYEGYPTGYIITWKNPDVKTKAGTIASGNHVLIDGQQRITALMAALSGRKVLDEDFHQDRIKIAFQPFAKDTSKRFAVQDASHVKDKSWLPDIAEIFQANFDTLTFSLQYQEENPSVSASDINTEIVKLKEIVHRQIGVIELDPRLSIEEVTEIFVRINSKGTQLSQSDFVMSKMASDLRYGGNLMRKAVDYFCHLAVKPEFYSVLLKDQEFAQSEYAKKMAWLAKDHDDIYDPDYNDVLRVSFMMQFHRSKLSDLVSLLSGRDFATRDYKEEIVEQSFSELGDGLLKYMNEYSFKQFVLAIRSAGFSSSKLINSNLTLDFCYMLYLKLREDKAVSQAQVKRYIQKWFVLTSLTSRYIGSPESVMGKDIRSILEKGFLPFFKEVESSALSESFWAITLPQNLETTSVNSPAFHVFLAAQEYFRSHSFLQKGTMVSDLINVAGDIHHIFPKAYLRKQGMDRSGQYNQVANYVYLDSQVNKAIGEAAPSEYLGRILHQCKGGKIEIGNLSSIEDFYENLRENGIPEKIVEMDADDYSSFLQERRQQMAEFISSYYKAL